MGRDKDTLIGKNWRGDLLLLFTTCFLLFWSLGDRGLWGSEGRWAEITRQMFLTGDFFHPSIGGEPYFDKPLLTYWLIGAVSTVTGELNEWVVRLPSAVFGFISIWATVFLGRRLWSAGVGRWAGWLLLTSYGLLFWSRAAAADTENLAAITLCILWYWVRRDRPNFTTFLIFYLIAFIGALTKGLTALVIPIIAILPDLVMEKRWKALLKPAHVVALVASAAVYLSPFIYATMTRPQDYHSSGLALVFQENILRYFKAFDHKQPFYIYLYAVPLLLLPWAPLFIASLVGMLPVWKNLDKKVQWLMKAIGMIFLFFTLSGSRREYYILPIVPLCALLIAVFLVHIVHERAALPRLWGIKIQRYVGFGLILSEIVLPFVLLVLKMRSHFDFFVKLGVSGIVVAVIAYLSHVITDRWMRRQNSDAAYKSLPGLISIAVVIFGGFFLWQQPIIDTFRTERVFIEAVKTRVDGWPASSIGFFPKNDAKLLFYLDKREAPGILKTASDWDHFFSGQEPKLLIMQSKDKEKVPADYKGFLQRQQDIAENIQPWDSATSRRKKWQAWIFQGKPAPIHSVSRSKEEINHAN